MAILLVDNGDERVMALRTRLWPAEDGVAMPAIAAVFLFEEDGTPLGFLDLAIRSFSDGCESMPVPHVEGWYVEPFARGRGVGRALMEGAIAWSRERGFTELASDTEVDNARSLAAHQRCGFVEVERLIKLRRLLE